MFMNGVFVVYFCLIGMDCVIKIYMLGICEYSSLEFECALYTCTALGIELLFELFLRKDKPYMQLVL